MRASMHQYVASASYAMTFLWFGLPPVWYTMLHHPHLVATSASRLLSYA